MYNNNRIKNNKEKTKIQLGRSGSHPILPNWGAEIGRIDIQAQPWQWLSKANLQNKQNKMPGDVSQVFLQA
jgi:hypothetical protein